MKDRRRNLPWAVRDGTSGPARVPRSIAIRSYRDAEGSSSTRGGSNDQRSIRFGGDGDRVATLTLLDDHGHRASRRLRRHGVANDDDHSG